MNNFKNLFLNSETPIDHPDLLTSFHVEDSCLPDISDLHPRYESDNSGRDSRYFAKHTADRNMQLRLTHEAFVLPIKDINSRTPFSRNKKTGHTATNFTKF